MTKDAAVLAERWAMLLPEQRTYVARALNRAAQDAMRHAERSRRKAKGAPQPYRKHKRNAAWQHAANAGAVRIARDLLAALRTYP